MPLRKDGGIFILDMWIWVPTSRTSSQQRPRKSMFKIWQTKRVVGGGCKDIMSYDEDILTLNVDAEALEEEMECELEDETVQEPERVRTISKHRTAQQERT